jgi:nicotinate-nucleotide adenylyltransferase
MKIGLYFGSFNPVHNGHLIIANYVINNTDIQQLWMVVSPQNPLKPSKGLLNEYQRLNLIELAIEGESKIKASTIEFKLPKPSYTIDTLAYLKEKYPEHQFSIIMGSDSFTNLPKWKNYQLIVNNYNIFIYQRKGYPIENEIKTNVHLLDAPIIEISSTRIREMIKKGKSIRYLVPDIVKEEIEKTGFYK